MKACIFKFLCIKQWWHCSAACILLLITQVANQAVAQEHQPKDDARCIPCERPGEFTSFADSVMDVQFADGGILRNVRSAARTTHTVLGRDEQAIRLTWRGAHGECLDTIVPAESVTTFLHEGIGGSHSPLRYPVAPAREIYRENNVTVKRSFVEVFGLLGYGGNDSTSRKIGFKSLYESVEAVAAPFGALLGNYLSIGVGGGLLFEGGRLRFPLYGELRLTFPASEHVEIANHYVPDSCQFGTPGSTAIESPWSQYSERSFSRTDQTVFLTEEKAVTVSPLRPYIYIEGGTLFDSRFDGSGTPANAVNPQDRKPLLLGAGVGALFGPDITAALGYRYMQLYLATPCEQCVDRSIINQNKVHSVRLSVGYHFAW